MATADRRVLVALCVVALLAASAVVVLGGDDASELPENATAIERTVSDRVSNLESYRLTLVQTVEYGNRTQRTRARIVYDSGRYNVTFLETPGGQRPIYLANETTQWHYVRGGDVVYRQPRNTTRTPNLLARSTEAVFAHRNVTYDGTETVAGSETVALSYSRGEQAISLSIGGSRLSRLVAPEEYGNATTRIWVDAERRIPVRVRTTATRGDETVERTLRFEDVELGVDVAADRLDAPPVGDAPVVTEQRPAITRYDTRTALVENTSGPVPRASIPDGFEFGTGLRVRMANGTTVTQAYTDGVSRIGVMRTDPNVTDDVEPNVTVAGRPAEFEERYVHYGHGRVRWRCGEYEYFVSARVDATLTKSSLFDIAESVGCPT